MALGQMRFRIAWHAAQNGDAGSPDGLRHQAAMPFAADFVEDNACNRDTRVKRRAAFHNGPRRLRLPADIDH